MKITVDLEGLPYISGTVELDLADVRKAKVGDREDATGDAIPDQPIKEGDIRVMCAAPCDPRVEHLSQCTVGTSATGLLPIDGERIPVCEACKDAIQAEYAPG